jgi:Mitochondrial K+-H+ exchange-related
MMRVVLLPLVRSKLALKSRQQLWAYVTHKKVAKEQAAVPASTHISLAHHADDMPLCPNEKLTLWQHIKLKFRIKIAQAEHKWHTIEHSHTDEGKNQNYNCNRTHTDGQNDPSKSLSKSQSKSDSESLQILAVLKDAKNRIEHLFARIIHISVIKMKTFTNAREDMLAGIHHALHIRERELTKQRRQTLQHHAATKLSMKFNATHLKLDEPKKATNSPEQLTFNNDDYTTSNSGASDAAHVRDADSQDPRKIKVIIQHPTSIRATDARHQLLSIAQVCYTSHRRNMYLSALCIPLSMSAGILPGPNVFLIYNLLRLWLNWKCMHGAQALTRGKCDIECEETSDLDEAWSFHADNIMRDDITAHSEHTSTKHGRFCAQCWPESLDHLFSIHVERHVLKRYRN